MRRFKWITAAALLAGMATVGAAPACAAVVLTITDAAGSTTGTLNTTIGDPGYGTVTSTSSGTVAGSFQSIISPSGDKTLGFSGTVGTIFFDISTAATSNTPGTPSLAKLNLSSNTITNLDGAQSFTIATSANGYTAPSAPPQPGVVGNISTSGTLTNGTLTGTFSGSADASYAPSPISLSVTGPGSLASTPPGTFIPVFPTSGSPFSMTSTFQATLSAGASTASLGGAIVITAVPEPSTVVAALSGVGLIGLGALRRKFRSQV